MPKTSSNAAALLLTIFQSWKIDNFPSFNEGSAFEIFASELVLRSYGLATDDIHSGIVGGGQDGAIDSIYTFFDDYLIDEDSDVVSESRRPTEFSQNRALELWVIQTKKSQSFEEGALDKLENSLRRLLDLSESLDSLSSLYNESVLQRIQIFRSAWEKLLTRRPAINVNVAYATLGNPNGIAPQVSAKVVALKAVIASAVPDAREISVDLVGDRELLTRYNERPSYALPMSYQESVTSGESHIALVKLRDYYNLIVDENDRLRKHLFEWNVRDYQGNVAVNQDIRRTLTTTEAPEFWWLNNGVTIICSDATSAGKTYSLEDIQIVNGLQTSHEIYDALKNGSTAEVEDRMLLVRIVVTEDPATRDQVIRATNRQTNVSDASLRATDEIQRDIENYFFTKGWYYDRRKNFYKNDGRDAAKIVGIPYLGAAITAMGLSRPDKARGKPSSLLKNDDDYKSVFNSQVKLETYLWAAKLQRAVDSFIGSEDAEASVSQRSNLRYHLSMLIVDQLNDGPIHGPGQLNGITSDSINSIIDDVYIKPLFEKLKIWSDDYLKAENAILERATKSQRFSEYLLKRTQSERERPGQ